MATQSSLSTNLRSSAISAFQYRSRPHRLVLLLVLLLLAGCQKQDSRQTITLWHQMVPRERLVLREQVAKFEAAHPDLHVNTLYKETEELRSGFQAAALAGTGPELVYGPSDPLGTFQKMGILQDMDPWVEDSFAEDFREGALTFLPSNKDAGKKELVQIPDRYGNHLALVYNRKFIAKPPETTDELIEMGKANTLDKDGDGRMDRYGLVWTYVEPFFAIPFLTGHGAWVFDNSGQPVPALDTPESVAAYQFILSLRDKHKIVPPNCDYETADSLFKSGRAAMIINGDWSWADYLATEGIDAAVAPLPIVSSTGKPMQPMVAPKGYSLNVHASPQKAAVAMQFVHFITSEDAQLEFMQRLRTLPSRKSLYESPWIEEDPTLKVSRQQLEKGRIMPVETELRAVWDGMKPHYQSLLGGNSTPEAAVQGHAAGRRASDRTDESSLGGEYRHLGMAVGRNLSLRGATLLAAEEPRRAVARFSPAADCLSIRHTLDGYHFSDRCFSFLLQCAVVVLQYVLVQFSGLANHRVAKLHRCAGRSGRHVLLGPAENRLLDRGQCIPARGDWTDVGHGAQWPNSRQSALPHHAYHPLGRARLHHRTHVAQHVSHRIWRGQSDCQPMAPV